jgi:hypothetical protein
MSNEQERRAHERSEVRIRVFLQLGEEEEVVLYTRDFSNGGAFIECPPLVTQALQANMSVQLSWYQNRRSADGYEVVPAHVVRVAKGGIAVHFDREVANQFAAA